MIRHIVLINFKPETSDERVAEIFSLLETVKSQVPQMLRYSSGHSESPEMMERGFMHGMVIDFTDWDGLKAYADNGAHKALGAQLVDCAVGGIDGILVFDYQFDG